MEVLYFLESIRNPVLDAVVAIVTHLGSEAAFLAAALCVFWCIDKKAGYYMLFTGFVGITLNQFLKLAFRIERPWVKDPNFNIVESARAEATGYSFPSGHTQNAAGVFGSIALYFRKSKAIMISSIVVIVLVAFSRLYLGVHTPLDVGVSLVVAALLVFLIYPIINTAFANEKIMYTLMAFVMTVSVIYICYVEFYNFPADIDPVNYNEGLKNAYSLFGAVLGFPIIYFLDKKYIKFTTDAPIWAQAVKLVVGAALAMALKSLLKSPLYALFDGHHIAGAVRYFVVVLFAGALWPLTFRLFPKKKAGEEQIVKTH